MATPISRLADSCKVDLPPPPPQWQPFLIFCSLSLRRCIDVFCDPHTLRSALVPELMICAPWAKQVSGGGGGRGERGRRTKVTQPISLASI